jgi:hypothetical protein
MYFLPMHNFPLDCHLQFKYGTNILHCISNKFLRVLPPPLLMQSLGGYRFYDISVGEVDLPLEQLQIMTMLQ